MIHNDMISKNDT